MGYLSWEFFLLVFMFVIVYYLIPVNKKGIRGTILLLASLAFYCSYNINYLFFLLFTSISTFISALILDKRNHRKVIVSICIVSNILLWYYVKVMPWTIHTFNRFLKFDKISELDIIVPIGISYYVLQSIGYLIDVYKGKFEPEKSFWKYFLFISYFPAIVQGPISRYEELMPQLLITKKFSWNTIKIGLFMILIGLVKKMVIADRIGIFVNSVFASYSQVGGVSLSLAAVLYAIQLYTDFSGCVDLCRGVSLLFGINLTDNFNRPYLSRSVKEFWGKWHISLSKWLMEYIYIPLGGNKYGIFNKYRNIMITFLISGLWHGAGFSFFFWGGLHAIYLILGEVTFSFCRKTKEFLGIKQGSFSEHFYQVLSTFILVDFAWIFFRSESFIDGLKFVKRMFKHFYLYDIFNGSVLSYGVDGRYFILLFIHIVILFVFELCTKYKIEAIYCVLRQHLVIRWMIYLILFFDILLFGVYGNKYNISSFMYGGF